MSRMKKINNIEVGKRIKGLAKEHGYYIAKIQMDTGLSYDTISRMNRGISLTKDNIGIIARYYGVAVDYILYGNQEKSASDKDYYLERFEQLDVNELKKLYNIAVASDIIREC